MRLPGVLLPSVSAGLTWEAGTVLSYPPADNIGGLIGPSVGIQAASGTIYFSQVFGGEHWLYVCQSVLRVWCGAVHAVWCVWCSVMRVQCVVRVRCVCAACVLRVCCVCAARVLRVCCVCAARVVQLNTGAVQLRARERKRERLM